MPKAKVKDILTYATENKFGVAAINTLSILCKLSIGKRDVNEKSNPPAMLGRME